MLLPDEVPLSDASLRRFKSCALVPKVNVDIFKAWYYNYQKFLAATKKCVTYHTVTHFLRPIDRQ